MLAKVYTAGTASPLLANAGHSIIGAGRWKTTLIAVIAAILASLLIAQFGQGARLEKGAEIALSRARELLHEADQENRRVRPLPLSLSKSDV
jgi:hypothetical protein